MRERRFPIDSGGGWSGAVGRRGPPRTETKVLKMRGTWRGDRHGGQQEPEYESLEELPEPPGFFDPIAVYEWERIGPSLIEKRVLTAMDLAAFSGYCLNVARMVKAERLVAKEGLVVDGPMGEKAHPAVMIARQSEAEVLKFAKEFGITPASRTRVSVPQDDVKPAAKDPWEDVG
jgi:P27 family predicted phage terminase small subunit